MVMLRKTMIALLAVASVGLASPTIALARGAGGGGGGHGGGFGGFRGGQMADGFRGGEFRGRGFGEFVVVDSMIATSDAAASDSATRMTTMTTTLTIIRTGIDMAITRTPPAMGITKTTAVAM
jgi:hypothetical protein